MVLFDNEYIVAQVSLDTRRNARISGDLLLV